MGVNDNPYTAMLEFQRQQARAAADAMEKATEAPDRAERMGAVEVGQTPSETVYRENKLELLHYESQTDEQYDVPILIVYALINRPYILDLQPDRSVVRTLLEQGFDVYMIDWNEPSFIDQHLTLDDYVNRYIDNCVDVVRERAGLDAINVLGYCMGGTMSVMYAALHPEKVRNLALMAAGLCFDDTGGVLELWGDEEYYEPSALRETFGNVPADFLDVGFALMDPVDNFLTKYVRLYDNLEDEDFVENFARMERWLGDGIDVAGETYTQFLEDIYQDNKLARNELEVGGRRVDLADVRMPILQIVGEYDHLIPPEASKPFNELVGSEDVTTMEASTGHIGLSVSSRSHAQLWPDVCDWFAARSDVEVPGEDGGAADVDAGVDEPVESVEPAVSGDGGPAATTADAAAEPEPESEPESESESEPESEADVDVDLPDVRDLRGVGPTYASRLREAGYGDVAALAADDAETVAGAADVPVGRARDWIDQARALLEADADDADEE